MQNLKESVARKKSFVLTKWNLDEVYVVEVGLQTRQKDACIIVKTFLFAVEIKESI